jgi:hypothetical protein
MDATLFPGLLCPTSRRWTPQSYACCDAATRKTFKPKALRKTVEHTAAMPRTRRWARCI